MSSQDNSKKEGWSLSSWFSRNAGQAEGGDGNSRAIAIAVIVIGGLGAVASAMRPILRQKYGGSGPTRAQKKTADSAAIGSPQSFAVGGVGVPAAPSISASLASGAESPQVAPLLARLRELQRWHQARHPLWYGRPTPELAAEGSGTRRRRVSGRCSTKRSFKRSGRQ
jgi:hypothetical protein